MKLTFRLLALVILLLGTIITSEVAGAQSTYGANTVASCSGVAATGGCAMWLVPLRNRDAANATTWQTTFTGTPTAITINLEGSINQKSAGDAICTSGSTTVTSATAAFAAIDAGKVIYLVGCGAAGANLITTISSVTNATSIVVGSAPSTSVFTGTQAYYGTWFQLDQSTSTTAEMRHVVNKPILALRCNITVYTVNGSTTTCQFLTGNQ